MKDLRNNLLWDYLSKFGNTIFSLITTTILARLLSPADYGLVGISAAVNGIGGVFFNFGLSSAIIQSENADKKTLSTVFYLNQSIAIFLWILIATLSNTIENFYKINQLSNVLLVTSLVFVINGALMVPNAMLAKEMKFKSISIISLISNFLSGAIGITMALNQFGVWSLVVQQLCNSSIILIGSILVTKWIPSLMFSINAIKPMLRFGIFMFLSGLLDSIYTRIDIFLIGKLFSPATLGQYTRAQGLEAQVRILSANSLLGVLFPTFTKIKHEKEQLTQLYYKFFELVSFSFCLIGSIFFLSSNKLFLLLFGNQWGESSQYFQLLIIVGFAYPLSSLTLSIIEARGNSKNFLKVEIVKKIIFLPTYFVAFYFGIIYYLYAYIIACIIGTFANVFYLKFEIPITLKNTFFKLFKYFFSSAIIITLIYLIKYYNNYSNSILNVFLEVSFFVTFYLVYHFFTNSKGLKY